jgi:hypothetical protein
MHIPGPYSDDTWQWLPEAWGDRPVAGGESNGPADVLREIGLLLAIPLAGAGIVGLILRAAGIT